jgi:hypothetical protein
LPAGSRLYPAEKAQAQVYRAMSHGGDSSALKLLLVAGRMLDFAGYKFLTGLEVACAWRFRSLRLWRWFNPRRSVLPCRRPLPASAWKQFWRNCF